MFRFRAAVASALSEYTTTYLDTNSLLKSGAFISLRQFSSAPSPPPPPPSPEKEKTPGEEQPTPTTKEDEGDDEHSPAMEAIRSSIQHQITTLRSSSSMMEQTMEDSLPPWQRLFVNTFAQWFQSYFAEFIQVKIEREFDLHDFLEGAKDAFWTVHSLLGDEDMQTLQPMVSRKLLNAVKATGEEYRSGGLIWRTEIDTDVPLEAQLRRISLWSATQIAAYDKERAAEVPENASSLPLPAGKWLVLWVQYTASQRTLITREEDGQVVAKLTDQRPALWTFAAGPLPEGAPVDRLETPYWLLKFG